MDINWLGHSCFRIKGKESTIVTDPCHPSTGYNLSNLQADLVTVSHFHNGHSYLEAVTSDFKEIKGSGEYELQGTFITGISTFHDADQGRERGKNTVYLLEIDGMILCHLGDIGHLLTSELIEAMGEIDVLFLPVGGVSTIGATRGAEMVRKLSPKIVIPMHYKTEVSTKELESADKFLRESGINEIASQPKLVVNSSNLPPSTRVIVLDFPHQ